MPSKDTHTQTSTHTLTNAHTHTQTLKQTYTQTHTHMHTLTNTHTHTYRHTHTHTHIHILTHKPSSVHWATLKPVVIIKAISLYSACSYNGPRAGRPAFVRDVAGWGRGRVVGVRPQRGHIPVQSSVHPQFLTAYVARVLFTSKCYSIVHLSHLRNKVYLPYEG